MKEPRSLASKKLFLIKMQEGRLSYARQTTLARNAIDSLEFSVYIFF